MQRHPTPSGRSYSNTYGGFDVDILPAERGKRLLVTKPATGAVLADIPVESIGDGIREAHTIVDKHLKEQARVSGQSRPEATP